jgi:hypothetical protein
LIMFRPRPRLPPVIKTDENEKDAILTGYWVSTNDRSDAAAVIREQRLFDSGAYLESG